MRRLRATARLTAWTAALVVALRLLLRSGSASLSIPVTSLDDLDRWLSETPPADMTMAVLRLGALVAVGYLLAATALTVVAQVARVRGLKAAADRVSPAVVRRIVTGGSGVGLVLGGAVASLPLPDLTATAGSDAVASAPATPDGAASPSVATMARLPGQTATMTAITDGAIAEGAIAAPGPSGAEATMTRVEPPPPPSATMTRVDDPSASPFGDEEGPVLVTPVANQPGAHSSPTAPTAPPWPGAPEIDPSTWVVEPGDSLWSIAEEVMTAPDGSTPNERTVSRYWQRLVEANRANLVDPDNADLLVPGQRLAVPPPST
jgi:nucleoid-associated protein YgaU